MSDVAQFWNQVAGDYNKAKPPDYHHINTAKILTERLRGDVLAVGGMWVSNTSDAKHETASAHDAPYRVTVLDVSDAMLAPYRAQGIQTLLGDARSVPLPDQSVDHILFAQVLHHITDDDARKARTNVHRCLAEAHRLLKPGGQVWLKEVVVPPIVYFPELLLAPVTRTALRFANIPLVILHSTQFFVDAMAKAGFADIDVIDTSSEKERWNDPVRPVVGLPWLQVPRILYPVRRDLFVGTRPHR